MLAKASEIKSSDIRAILRGIPKEWGLSRNDGEAVEVFLIDRAKYLFPELEGMLWSQTELGGGNW